MTLRAIFFQKTDPNGTTITNEYGATNLLQSSSYVNGSESNYISYSYDEGGVLRSVTDGGITNRYNTIDGEYIPDPYGLIFSDSISVADETRTVTYDYDEKNRLTELVRPSGEGSSYEYNGLDQITGLPGFISGEISYASNTYLSGYTFVNDVALSRSYDNKKRVTEISYNNSAEELDAYSLNYDLSDNIIQKNGDYFSYDGKGRLISGSLAGDSAGMDYEYKGESDIMDVQPDILGNEEMITLSGDDLILDWGAKSLGIDLGYGYRVSKIILNPTISNTRIDEDTMEVYTSLYNMAGQYGEANDFSYSKNETTGEITITLGEVCFSRYIKIHSHFNEMDENGNYLEGNSEFELNAVAPYTVMIKSAGRNEFYNYDGKDNRTKLTYVTTDPDSYIYTYYASSDLIKTDGTYGYKYDANGNMIAKGNTYTENGNDLTIRQEDEYWEYEYDLLNRMTAVYKWNAVTEEVEFVKSYKYSGSNYRVVSTDAAGNLYLLYV